MIVANDCLNEQLVVIVTIESITRVVGWVELWLP